MKKYVCIFVILFLEKSFAVSVSSFEKSDRISIGIASGQFYNGRGMQPLLVVSTNQGQNWSYPADIYSSTTLPKYPFSGGGLFGTSCNDKICIASGVYSYEKTRPVIAITHIPIFSL